MNKKSKDAVGKGGEKTYQIRPPFKDKFRPGVSCFHLIFIKNIRKQKRKSKKLCIKN